MTAHEDWVQTAIRATQIEGELFTKPDDDWRPLLLGQSVKGGRGVMDISWAFETQATKEAFASVLLPSLIVSNDLHRVAFVASSWLAADLSAKERENARRGEYVRPSEHPRRTEVVVIYACSDGVESVSTAEIKRDGTRPPRLAPWTQMTTHDTRAASFQGLFAEPIREAVNLVRHARI